MWTLVLKSVGSILSGFIAKWRIIAFVSVFVAGVGAYVLKIKGLERQITEANDELAIKTIEAYVLNISNKAYVLTQDSLVKANRQCVLNNLANDDATKLALTELELSSKIINKKYEDLKNTKVISICGNAKLDDSVIELLYK